MMYTVSITSQGQISIPAAIRRQLGLDKLKKALVSVADKKIMIEPVEDFLEMIGSFKTDKKPLANEELHELFAQSVADKYANTVKK